MTARERWRLAAASVVLVAVALLQAPERLVGDTKADLVIDPTAFLARALDMWDPNGWFGQVQNQAYGYLFPMGPFFALGEAVHVPMWLVQRAWWVALLVMAFTGVVAVARAMRIGSVSWAIFGGLAYALSPRVLTLLGSSSVEAWPMATAPWVLYAVIRGTTDRRPLRWAALAGFFVALTGGVNAVAAAAVLPLPILWLLTRRRSPQRRTMLWAWPAFTFAGTAWWLGPLLLLGRYSPPFLDYIESAATTTSFATVADALRGTSNWVAYADVGLAGGHAMVAEPVLILNTFAVVIIGLMGLAMRPPHARFLVLGLLMGLVLVTLGHDGTNVAGQWWQSLLDGALAPVRNTHKFDLVLRIPLCLGLVHFVAASTKAVGEAGGRAWVRYSAAFLAAIAMVSATAPAWSGTLARDGSWQSTPEYWSQAASWLGEQDPAGGTLILPSSAFGDYLWGSTRDDVMQAFATTPWTVRSGVPLTPPGSIRTLDALAHQFDTGRGSAALAAALERSGVRYVLLRNDLQTATPASVERIYSTLASTPGVTLEQGFGPVVGSPPIQRTDVGDPVYVNWGLQSRHRVVEIYRVSPSRTDEARVQPVATTEAIAGASAAVLDAEGSTYPNSDVVLAQDTPSGWVPSSLVVTDTFRRRDVSFGRIVQNYGATLSLSDPSVMNRPVADYVAPGDRRWQAVRVDVGAKVWASSSRSDADEARIDVTAHVGAALDGDPRTAWIAGAPVKNRDGKGVARYRLTFDERTDVSGMRLTLGDGFSARRVTVTTDDGSRAIDLRPGATAEVPGVGATKQITLTAGSSPFDPFAIAEISIPGVGLGRPLWVPTAPKGWPSPREVNLSVGPETTACFTVLGVVRCDPEGPSLSEDGRVLDRVVTVREPVQYLMAAQAVPEPSAATIREFSGPVIVRPLTQFTPTTTQSGLAMVDGDPSTGWIAGAGDDAPGFVVELDRPTEVGALRLAKDDDLAASQPAEATISFEDGTTRSVKFSVRGLARFDAVTTERFTVRVTRSWARSSLGLDGVGTVLPVGVSELTLPGSDVDAADGADENVTTACGTGPTLTVDSVDYRTRVTSTRRGVVAGESMPVGICDAAPVDWSAGTHRVTARASDVARPTRVRLAESPAPANDLTTRAVTGDPSTTRTVDGTVPPESFVALSQNTNVGWSVDRATPLTVDGWRQGWWVRDGGPVEATIGPAALYRVVLFGGLLGLLGLALAVGLLWRRSRQPAAVEAPGRRGRGVLEVAVAVCAVVVGGPVGLAAAAVGFLTGQSRIGRAVVVVPLTVVTLWYVLRPWGNPAGWAGDAAWAQWLAVLSVSAAAGCVAGPRRWPQRIHGASTNR